MKREFTRGQLNDLIAELVAQDPRNRQALLEDTKAAIERLLGRGLPDRLAIEVVEDRANTVHLVLPHTPSGELSDADLEAVAGGKNAGSQTYSVATLPVPIPRPGDGARLLSQVETELFQS